MSIFKVNPNSTVPAEQRQNAYARMYRKQDGEYLIVYNDKFYTVDEANDVCSKYMVEGNTTRVQELQTLIVTAKEYIRSIYPDV